MEEDNKPFFNLPSLKSMDKYEMNKFLDKDIELEKYFSKKELEEMGQFEQKRYKNMVQNYEIMLHLGLPVVKPNFMKGPAFRARLENERQKTALNMSSSGSDDEWTPYMERKQRAKEKRNRPTFMCLPKTKQKSVSVLPTRPKRKCKKEKEMKEVPQGNAYEFRKKRTTNFMNLEPPDDDHFLYCEECNKEYQGDCPVHGPLIYVEDTKVEEIDPDRALHSLPPCLYVKESSISGAGLGVFTKEEILPRTMFGPYGGIEITDPDIAHCSGYCWQIYIHGVPNHFVDAKDAAHSNWMRYVNCALSESDQNLVAFQFKGGIYYRSFKLISPETELLVWYGNEYAKEMGIYKNVDPIVIPKYVNGECVYSCGYCKAVFSDTIYWVKHVKAKHAGNMPTEQLQKINKWCLANYSRLNKFTVGNVYKIERQHTKSINTKAELTKLHTEERPYKCDVCGKSFNENGHLVKHKRIHTGERPYKCDVCGKSFNENGPLVKHKRIHTGERPYKCDVCGKSFNQNGPLVKHKRLHTGERPYKCDVCGKSFNENGHLVKHKRLHTGERPYKCDVCGKSFNQNGHLVTHKRIHTGERPYKCDVCGKSFNQNGPLVKHKRLHTGERPYKCDVCGKSFNVSSALVNHKRLHTGERPYKCDVCGKSFNENGHLVNHKRLHTGERPYKCDVCGKSFNENGHLVRHKRIHTGERPYKCDVCGKSFNENGHLVKHKRLHTGERPYKCDVCGKSFNENGHLVRHKRLHTGERPYKCDVCGKSFNENGHLVNHKRLHTGERPYKCYVCGKSFTSNSALVPHKLKHN